MKKTSIILYYLSALTALAFGCLYFFKPNLMDYHYAFIKPNISKELLATDYPRVLELMEAFKKIIGACLIGLSIASGILTYFYSKNFNFLGNIGLMVSLLIPNATLLAISYHVAHSIPEGEPRPPWMLSVLVLGLIFGAFITSLLAKKD